VTGTVGDQEERRAAALERRYLIRFEEDTLRSRPLSIRLLVLFASPISGSSMNPVRTLGPDIVGANFTGWWAYVFGELIGAIIAVALIALVRGMPDAAERTAAEGGTPQ
jgi:Major intrinsic protein